MSRFRIRGMRGSSRSFNPADAQQPIQLPSSIGPKYRAEAVHSQPAHCQKCPPNSIYVDEGIICMAII
jgi:hypothetical protein